MCVNTSFVKNTVILCHVQNKEKNGRIAGILKTAVKKICQLFHHEKSEISLFPIQNVSHTVQ